MTGLLSCSTVAPPQLFFNEIAGFKTSLRSYLLKYGCPSTPSQTPSIDRPLHTRKYMDTLLSIASSLVSSSHETFVKEHRRSWGGEAIVESASLTPSLYWKPFWGTNSLDISIGKGFGVLKGLTQSRRKQAIYFCMILVVYLGHGIFHPGTWRFFFLLPSQFCGEVVTFPDRGTPEKKWCASILARVPYGKVAARRF